MGGNPPSNYPIYRELCHSHFVYLNPVIPYSAFLCACIQKLPLRDHDSGLRSTCYELDLYNATHHNAGAVRIHGENKLVRWKDGSHRPVQQQDAICPASRAVNPLTADRGTEGNKEKKKKNTGKKGKEKKEGRVCHFAQQTM